MESWEKKLSDLGQAHVLTEALPEARAHICEQLDVVERNYPRGVRGYLENARQLLRASKLNEDSFKDFRAAQPPTTSIDLTRVDELYALEREARGALHQLGFVLVAGGLGERLGYPDIKVKLFTQITREMTYLEYYCRCILKCEETAAEQQQRAVKLPFFIMTSGDTHERTLAFLEENDYFGLDRAQVYVRQQEKVPALENSEGRIALARDRRSIETKPHGHGDVHLILYSQGLLKTFKEQYGTEWLFFFQDTNALAFRALHLLLGVSMRQNLSMNSLAIPRLAGEAVGAICQLRSAQKDMVLNVEYNQLDSMLKAAGLPGDVPVDSSKGSQFPGNCNILVFKLSEYWKVLETSQGRIPEFVNPKYADAERQAFKSPTRIECMMQEIPRLFSPEQKHGCTLLDRWFCFSTVKNCCADASKKVTPECAFSAEQDLYFNARKCLELVLGHAKVDSEAALPQTFNGVQYDAHCRVWLSPAVAVSLLDLKEALEAAHVSEVALRHQTAFLLTPTDTAVTLPIDPPRALTSAELDDPKVPTNYKVRGYCPATFSL